MAGVAIHGSDIAPVVKPNHVTYTIEYWQSGYCNEYDDLGNCIDWVSGYWYSGGTGSTGAKIIGKVSTSSSKLKIQGNNVAKVGDVTNETWVADPPVPSDTSTTRYRNVSPGTSGSGQGRISGGSSKAKTGTQAVALIGSEVTTHLGVTTTIANGNTKMNIGS